MAKEWIDVADTAIKIGLGSLITGVFTYLGIQFSRKSEKSKFLLEHKVSILEKIASDSEEYISAWTGLTSLMAGIAKEMDHELEEVVLNVKQLEWLKDRDKKLTESWVRRRSVLSKLRLLKAGNTIKKLEECIEIEAELRNILFFDKSYPNYNQVIEYRDRAMSAQKKFQEELAETYEKMSA